MTSRTEAEGTSTFTFGTSATAKNIGQLASMSGPGGYGESYTYDVYSRPQTTTITADTSYVYDYAYNTQGTLDTLTYPVSFTMVLPTGTINYRLKLQYEYQAGRLLRVNLDGGTVLWQANAMDARGHVIDEFLGYDIQTIRGYDAITGQIDYIQTDTSSGSSIQNLSYTWDQVGNLTQRQDVRQSLTERFYYDNLHRLDYSTRNGVTNLDMAYDALGNITSRSDVGTYAYHATKKHAVASTSGTIANTYTYDANGNMATRNGVTTTWTSYNLPNKVSQSATTWSQFSYTPTRQRWKQQISDAGNTETWYSIGGLMEKRYITSTNIEYRHQIQVGGTTVAIYTLSTPLVEGLYYVSRDHLGSTNVIMDPVGAALVDESFTAFGSRRGSTWTGAPSAADVTQIKATTRRGFTDHEHLDHLNLIHMNGRMFDPVIGRFMSADPYVQDQTLTQSFNRYSYTSNNPLSYVDPSGFGACSFVLEYLGLVEHAAFQSGTPCMDPPDWSFPLFPTPEPPPYLPPGGPGVPLPPKQPDPPVPAPKDDGEGEPRTQTPGKCPNMAPRTAGQYAKQFVNDTTSTILGIADTFTFGGYTKMTEAMGFGTVNHDLAYNAGLYGTAAISGGRLLYAGASSAIQYVPAISAVDAVAARNTLKGVFSTLGADHPRAYSASSMIAKYGSETEVIKAASRTNASLNTAAAELSYSAASQTGVSGCP